ncbi:MAG: YciI family protein [bacterium]
MLVELKRKEALGGCYILECASMDEVLAWAERMPTMATGQLKSGRSGSEGFVSPSGAKEIRNSSPSGHSCARMLILFTASLLKSRSVWTVV